jgi:DNA-binding Xre family transcriptional regulator
MSASYKKLWKLLIDKDMKKKDLVVAAGISNFTVSKLNRGENVTTEILGRICKALDCNIGDIMDFVDDDKK